MRDTTQDRAVNLGQYITQTGATVRAAARVFHISKSTVHKDISERLKKIDPPLYMAVKKIMDVNKSERHIRGGNATATKYKTLRELKFKKPER